MKTLTLLATLLLFTGEILGQNESSTNEDRIFTVVEQMPDYPGGNEAFLAFLRKELTYPKDALKDQIEGKVFVQFVINKEGFVSDVKVLKALHPLLDEEAVRVVKLMPPWKPGIQNARPVNVKFVLPFTFVPPKQMSQDSTSASVTGDEKVFTLVEQVAEYPGGMSELYKLINRKLKYPKDAKSEGVEGKVYIEFIVRKDGSVSDIQVHKGLYPSLDQEAVRVIALMPNWIPAQHNGHPVNSKFVIPVTFKK